MDKMPDSLMIPFQVSKSKSYAISNILLKCKDIRYCHCTVPRMPRSDFKMDDLMIVSEKSGDLLSMRKRRSMKRKVHELLWLIKK